jgi:acyl-CoA thioester hydrolase
MSDAAARSPVRFDAPPAAIHRHVVRVYFEDTDAGGIVYYANYLKFAERARTEMMRDFGASHVAMIEATGVTFAVRHCEVDFFRPAHLDDALEIESAITGIGAATLDMQQSVIRGGEELVRIQVRLACMNADGRATRIPAAIRQTLNRNR